MNLLVPLVLALAPPVQDNPCPEDDDGFSFSPPNSCCQSAQLNIPWLLDDLGVSGKLACFENCELPDHEDHEVTVLLEDAEPYPGFCDQYTATIKVDWNGMEIYSGLIHLKYSRTWDEDVDATRERRVWRFLVNGDLERKLNPQPCEPPPCTADFGAAHFAGSLDVACDRSLSGGGDGDPPGTASHWYTVRLDLHHLPGCLHHTVWSTRPLTGASAHDDRSWHIVAPTPFEFEDIVAVPNGNFVSEALRSTPLSDNPLGSVCRTEAELTGGALSFVGTECACNASGLARYQTQTLFGTASCDENIDFTSIALAIPGGETLPAFLSLPIGRHGSGLTLFPNNRSVVFHLGALQVFDGSTSCEAGDPRTNAVHGVSTSGVPFRPKTGGEFDTAMDLANHRLPTASYGPGFGAPSFASLVWNIDFPQ